jgi:hypothetical protein
MFRCHHPEKFAHRRYADTLGLPLFALDEILVVTGAQDKINPTVRPVSAALFDGKTLAPEDFPDQSFKLAP